MEPQNICTWQKAAWRCSLLYILLSFTALPGSCLGPLSKSKMFHRLEDANVAHFTLAGKDPVLDKFQSQPENIFLRFFLAAQDLGNQTVLVRGVLQREPLDHAPPWGQFGSNPILMFQCLGHKWTPNITLSTMNGSHSFHVLFMDEVPGIKDWMRICGETGWWVGDNIEPFYMQAYVPSSMIDETLKLSIAGWDHFALYKLRPQVVSQGPVQFWNVLTVQPITHEITDYIDTLIFNIRYHQLVGFNGTLAFVRTEHLAAIIQNRVTFDLILQGKLKPVLWDGMASCEGFARCYEDNRFEFQKRNVPYDHPLIFSTATLMLWGENAFMALNDADEFLLINKPGMSIGELVRDESCFAGKSVINLPRFVIYHDLDMSEEVTGLGHSDWWRGRHFNIHAILSRFIYREIERDLGLGKTISKANQTLVAAVHTVYHGEYSSQVWHGNESCAMWGHVANLHRYRTPVHRRPTHPEGQKLWMVSTDWMWVLN